MGRKLTFKQIQDARRDKSVKIKESLRAYLGGRPLPKRGSPTNMVYEYLVRHRTPSKSVDLTALLKRVDMCHVHQCFMRLRRDYGMEIQHLRDRNYKVVTRLEVIERRKAELIEQGHDLRDMTQEVTYLAPASRSFRVLLQDGMVVDAKVLVDYGHIPDVAGRLFQVEYEGMQFYVVRGCFEYSNPDVLEKLEQPE